MNNFSLFTEGYWSDPLTLKRLGKSLEFSVFYDHERHVNEFNKKEQNTNGFDVNQGIRS